MTVAVGIPINPIGTKIEYQIDLLAGTPYAANSTTYIDIPSTGLVIVQVDVTKYVSPTFYFEAILRYAPAGTVTYAQLYNITDGVAVSGSEVASAYDSFERYRSGSITLSGTKQYKVQIRNTTKSDVTMIQAARIIVVDDITAGWTKGEEQVEIGNANETTTSGTAVVLNQPQIFLYESAKRDGTVTIYFEACLFSASAGKSVEVSLWDKTTDTQVVELATTNAVPTRVRSSAITLTNGNEYWVKKRSSSGKTCTVTGGKIIIDQSGTLTKTQLKKRLGIVWVTYIICPTWLAGTIVNANWIYLDKSNLPSGVTFYHEDFLRASAGYEARSRLAYFPITPIADSVVSTSNTTTTRVRSGAISLVDLQEYESDICTTGGTGYSTGASILIEVAPPAAWKFTENLSVISDVAVRRYGGLRPIRLDLSAIRDVFTFIYKKAPIVRKFVENLSVIRDVFTSVYTPVIRAYKLVQNLSVISVRFSRRVSQIRKWIEDLVVPEPNDEG